MSYVPLSTLKEHAAIIGDADDALLSQCLAAAEAHCLNLMNRRELIDDPAVPWATDDAGVAVVPDNVPAAVVQGVLIYATDFYETRGVSIVGTIVARNPAADALLHFYRVALGF